MLLPRIGTAAPWSWALALAASLCAAQARAADLPAWTRDGRFFVFEDDCSVEAGVGEERAVRVLDGRSGELTSFLLTSGKDCQLPEPSSLEPDPEGWKKWEAAHPLVEGTQPSEVGPEGARVQVKAAKGKVERREAGNDHQPYAARVFFCRQACAFEASLVRGALARLLRSYRSENFTLLDPYFSPDGRRVALFYFDRGDTRVIPNPGMNMPPEVVTHTVREVRVFSARGASVELVAPKPRLEAAFAKVAPALESAGFAVVKTGPAQKARASTVVYAQEGFEQAAQEIAALIPGGASTDKLTWKATGDVVVALGESVK